ncbi:hypothetical protein AX16_002391 [Volvariella volvacea WC 439]|nr:hypothetical protein AX16_002391 [Volvariella volvacea WC 439]
MFEPVRGGTRGGQAEFKWSDVSADKDREHYLGHSINAPTGRWQKNKDVHWYGRDKRQQDLDRLEEIRKIKEMEAEALSVALGFAPSNKPAGESAVNTAGAASSTTTITQAVANATTSDDERHDQKQAAEERKRRKAEKKAKKLEKERRGRERAERYSPSHEKDRGDTHRQRHRLSSYSPSRSRSPRRRSRDYRESEPRLRVKSPRRSLSPQLRRHDKVYDRDGREQERDRRRWELNASRRDGRRDRA